MKFSGKLASVSIFAALGLAAMAAADMGPFSSMSHVTQTAVSLSPAIPAATPVNVTVELFKVTQSGTRIVRNPNTGVFWTNETAVRAKVTANVPKSASVAYKLNGRVLATHVLNSSTDATNLNIDLSSFEDSADVTLQAVVSIDGEEKGSHSVDVKVDTEGPILTFAKFEGDPAASSVTMLLRFRDDDLDSTSAGTEENYTMYRIDSTGKATQVSDGSAGHVTGASIDGNEVTLTVTGPLTVGSYRVKVSETVVDLLNNPAGQERRGRSSPQTWTLSPVTYGPNGPAIAFPEYTQRRGQDPDADFNPGDHVETRVARLYYNRDAHRVAQIVNRNIQQWNRAGINNAREFAKNARSEADRARRDRENEEADAIAVSETLRSLQRQLTIAQKQVKDAEQRLAQVKEVERRLETLKADSGTTGPLQTPTKRDLIQDATVIAAQITDATIDDSTVVGGELNDDQSTTTAGQLRTGKLAKGQFSDGNITWKEPDGTYFRGRITEGLFDSTPGATLITDGMIDGESIKGLVTGSVRSGGVTTARSVTGSVVRKADIKEAVILQLVSEKPNPHKSEIARLENELERETGSSNPRTGDGSDLATAVADAKATVLDLESQISQQRDLMNQAKKEIANAERDEQLANRTQFEAEVAAATEDPDSYAPADLEAIDRVMQVSISVIGEGLIQLRGPIRGINEIRKMINQIDSPLGQVKVGLFTVQINGEQGDRMDEVASRIEGHIDLGRFMTNHSLQLLRRAIQEEAGEVISQVDFQYQQHRQVDRDRKYVYEFFGRDFVDELYAMDSEFLRTENKLLSLHAMDTVSLSQATFILALAKNDIRQKILGRFLFLVQTELPPEEYAVRRRNGMSKKARKANAMRRLVRIPGLAHDPEPQIVAFDEEELERLCRKACDFYRFANLINFFSADVPSPDVMTPVQREFIRLAQIFKSKMIAEVELKQRVIERALIQDLATSTEDRDIAREKHSRAMRLLSEARAAQAKEANKVRNVISQTILSEIDSLWRENMRMQREVGQAGASDLVQFMGLTTREMVQVISDSPDAKKVIRIDDGRKQSLALVFRVDKGKYEAERSSDGERRKDLSTLEFLERMRTRCECESDLTTLQSQGFSVEVLVDDVVDESGEAILPVLKGLVGIAERKANAFAAYRWSDENRSLVELEDCYIRRLPQLVDAFTKEKDQRVDTLAKACKVIYYFNRLTGIVMKDAEVVKGAVQELLMAIASSNFEGHRGAEMLGEVRGKLRTLRSTVRERVVQHSDLGRRVEQMFQNVEASLDELSFRLESAMAASIDERNSRVDLDHKKLLDFLIDEKEEKFIELEEGTRSHIAQIDNYLKRLAIALEDDFKVQFYDPAFSGVRGEGRDEAVTLGQIERTTVLTNNRALAKVSPQATMEFDLPKRAPVVVEAMAGAKAIMQDYGALVNDPAFVGLTGALSGAPAVGNSSNGSPPAVKPLYPTLGTDSQDSFLSGGPPGTPGGRQKTNLEQLIPDPAVYKIQTGTGFEIRPVIQPDGHSIIYDFKYLYTTNVREPVDPDEKHLGRVKQHYINTEVQTSSFELREISRYQVALKVSRTSRGVPLLEEIPIAGALFRPAPSDESSLQQNIILGQTTVYPTLFDLMGLRWSKHVADLDHTQLRDLEHVVRGRNRSINDYVFDRASQQVDRFLNIEQNGKDQYRPDLYRQQSRPSPYHPGGYVYPDAVEDPTGRNDIRPDRRPEEYRFDPEYDSLRGGPVDYYRQGVEEIREDSPLDLYGPANNGGSESAAASARDSDYTRVSRNALVPPAVQAKSAVELMKYERTAPAPRTTDTRRK